LLRYHLLQLGVTDEAALQRLVSMHGQLGAVDHGRGDHEL
jgi:hypothetical protein